MNWRVGSGDGVLPHIPSKASQKSGPSWEDNNSGSEHPPRPRTNKFSARPVVEVPHSCHAAAPVSSSSTRAQVPPVDPFSPTSPPSNSFEPPSSPLPGPSDPFDSMDRSGRLEGETAQGNGAETNSGLQFHSLPLHPALQKNSSHFAWGPLDVVNRELAHRNV
ncbi:hypothetical protein BS47DRAFT_1400157 [Hydnum rufescens UP504]|uniref:Uncharacterized protein n=1 Tax=Hydnum rufescens UP504 TaxID=1448309 RepID=A0A9P6AH78_9AGAM|nr:hypothetical protein BS47DRAFT_1400157 [Hydnum rufescens UP504]